MPKSTRSVHAMAKPSSTVTAYHDEQGCCRHPGSQGEQACCVCDAEQPCYAVIMDAQEWRQDRIDETEPQEQVEHPAHYGGGDNPYETIKVIEAWLTPEQVSGFLLGNTIKYLSRAGKKADPVVQDLQKARWYLDREIARLGAE